MFRDFHVMDAGKESCIFFPEAFKLYLVSREDGEALRRFLSEGAPLSPALAEMLRKEEDAAAERTQKGEDDMETDSLCLYMAHDCNLSCTYCYNDGGRSFSPSTMMPPELVEAAFRRFFTAPGKKYAVSFYGGEPLLNIPAIRRAIETGERLKKERGIDISYSMTTNGTVMNGEIIELLDRHFSNVTVSLDGPREVNDLHRKGPGYSAHERAMDNIERLIKGRSSVRVTVRATVTGDGVPHLENTVRFLLMVHTDGFSIAPVNTGSENPAYISDRGYAEFVDRFAGLTRHYFKDLVEGKGQGFKYTFNTVANLLSKRRFTRHCDAGKNPAVAADGSLYACHGLVGFEDFYMGNVQDGLSPSFSKVKESFSGLTVHGIEECSRCWARYLCGGSCYAHAYINYRSLYKPEERHCLLFKRNAEAVIGELLMAMEDRSKREGLYGSIRKALTGKKESVHEE